jgi:hypothetical protein
LWTPHPDETAPGHGEAPKHFRRYSGKRHRKSRAAPVRRLISLVREQLHAGANPVGGALHMGREKSVGDLAQVFKCGDHRRAPVLDLRLQLNG